MRIEKLILKNYAGIKTTFKTECIQIDFTLSKNKIILITGPNGSGKTTILSTLHPFANNGNLDVRSENPLIVKGKEGYKEIWIRDENNLYKIKHYYIPNKESHSVKSYIEKNDIELNTNGNVTSFKDIVKTELDIEMDYLKLTRLGSNVTNFIDLKATDRKAFMGKILDEVDIYLMYFKRITNKMREIKSIISHTLDKIEKLKISDKEELKKYQKKLKTTIEGYEKTLNDIKKELGIVDYEMNKYDTPLVIKENLDSKKKEMDKILRVLSKKGNESITEEECSKKLSMIELQLVEYKTKVKNLLENRGNELTRLDSLLDEKSTIEKELNKLENSIDIKNLESIIEELRKRMQERSKPYKLASYEPPCTKREMEDLIVTIDNCNDLLSSTYEFGIEPIKKANSYFFSHLQIDSYIEDVRTSSHKNKLQEYCEYVYKEIQKKIGKVSVKCDNMYRCKPVLFFQEVEDYATMTPDVIVEDDTFITYTKLAYQNISTIVKNISIHKSVLDKLPIEIRDMFKEGIIKDRIESLSTLCDKSSLYALLTKLTEYELYMEELRQLNEYKLQLKVLKNDSGNSEYMETRLLQIKEDITTILENVDTMSEKIEYLNSSIEELKNSSIEIEELKDSIIRKNIVVEEYEKLNTDYNTIREYYSKKKDITMELSKLSYLYEKMQSEYNSNEYRLQSYEELNKELKEYNYTYDEMTLVKNALSSKEGIPLLYMQGYLKNIREIANELLEVAYEDDLYLEDFNISADEFKIPYVTKGTMIGDVMYASQGERSFITLAISFSLIYQSISKYSIMLLDEVDSTLDSSNRQKFLQILEKLMEMIGIEQIFVISHNNMFEMYPVEVIHTKNKIENKNSLSHYLPIEIE